MVRFISLAGLSFLAGALAQNPVADLQKAVDALGTAIKGYTLHPSSVMFESITAAGKNVHERIMMATTAANHPMSGSDAQNFISAVTLATPHFASVLELMATAKSSFTTTEQSMIAQSLVMLSGDTADFTLAALINVPCQDREQVGQHLGSLVSGFSDALSTYTT